MLDYTLCDKLSVDATVVKRQTVCMTTEARFLKEFGSRLSVLRRKKNLTQEQLADIIDVHRTYIGFIEQGKRNPSIGNVYKITKALDIKLKDFFKPF